ncbi:TetR/AcrR family transcriptional regulator [Rothia sp. AR01]|uniref:TetR/AcrR family transcriptional regulator n=1 Tax=Rothia santali TaxID=2949643 RepID=A0A9X2KJZ0_9MICC|nr:TetR family transcriptional regulator [Rothia santali]MCP3424481.1 TetR/AcrR family transcriptional regulator [Rothia santali]
MPTRQPRSAATRDLILDAAAGEFASAGYGGTSHARILKALGKSTPNFITYHFPAKADLAHAVLSRQEELLRAGVDGLERRGIPGLEALVAIVFVVVTDEENMRVFRAAMALESDRTAPAGGGSQPCATWVALAERQLGRAREAGQLPRAVDLGDEAWTMVSALYGTYQLADRLGALDRLAHRVEQAWLPLLESLGVTDPAALLAAGRRHAREYLAARGAEPIPATPEDPRPDREA